MQTWKKFPRVVFYITLLIGLCAGMLIPRIENRNVHAAPMGASFREVIISEVAWGGTAANSADEWIELYNTTGSAISLVGWTLVSSDTPTPSPSIALAGSIPAYGYYLIECTDDFTISDIKADRIIPGTCASNLGNSGETLTLREGATVIDTANSDTVAWDGGSASPDYLSMERIDFTTDTAAAWVSNDGVTRNGLDANGNPVNGTPHNSQIDLELSTKLQSIAGSTVIFSVTVSNVGYGTATDVVVTDTLPSLLFSGGLTLDSYTSSVGLYDSSIGSWTVGSLSTGSSATLNITATTAAVINLYATEVSSWGIGQSDPDSIVGNGNPTEDDYDFIKIGSPTLGIVNDVNTPNPIVGTNVVFAITVSNPSTSINATNVEVAALLPYGLTYVSHSITTTSPILPSPFYTENSGVWTIGNLAFGTSATLLITARVVASTPPPYPAAVSSDNFANNIAIGIINNPLSGESNLTLAHDPLTVSTSNVDRVNLKIKLHNIGPDKATNVQVKDLLPSGLDYVSYSSSLGTYNSSTGIWAISEIASGADATLTISVAVASSGASTKNIAEVWKSDQFDPNSTPGNGDIDLDDYTTLEVPIADLNVSQTVSVAGSNAVFRITVRNNGPDDASAITIENKNLATNYTYVSHGFTADGSTAGFSYTATNGNWTIPVLLDGDSATLTVTTSAGTTVNWAQVSAVNEVDPDSMPGNCSGTISTCTEDDDAGAPSADLSLTQSVNNPNPNVGDNVIFSIKVTNAGIADTSGVQVKSILPSGLTYVSNDLGTAYSSTSGIWIAGALLHGETKTLNITATVATQGIKTNAAEVWNSDQDDPDSSPANGLTSEDDYATATLTSYRSIIINEVAWGGTAASVDDEWIELYNPTSSAINLTGWTLKSTSGSLSITLAGSISSGGYFLLERDDNSTVSDVSANQIYTGAMSDSGETLTLRDGSSYFIDTANGDGGAWPKGSLTNYASMERQDVTAETDSLWVTNTGFVRNGVNASGGSIYGTPGKKNSTGITPTATATVPPPTAIPPVGRPIINEFLARPGFDWNQDGKVDVFDEFIEIKNIGAVDINIGGWKLDDEANAGSNPFIVPSIILEPGQHAVFYGLQTNILLGDGGDTVRLLNPSEKVYDAYTYAIAKVPDQSVCRLPDGNGNWYEDCVPTPSRLNSREGEVPSMPDGEESSSPICDLPDTLHPDFLFAECRGYGADIWHSFFWDEFGWQGAQDVRENMSKWQSFVE